MTQHLEPPPMPQVIAQLEREYGLVGVFCEPIPGYDQTNFLIRTKQDRFFLRRYPYGQLATALYHAALNKHYENHGIPVATIIPNGNGDSVTAISGFPHLVQKYLNYPLLAQLDYSTTRLKEAGRWLARVHIVPPNQHSCPYEESLWNMERFDELLALYQAHGEKFPAPTHTAMEDLKLRWVAAKPHIEHLPRTIIHNDYHQNNLMFENDRCVGIIDFTESMPGSRIVDVAASLQYLAFGNICPQEVINSFLDGYTEISPLAAKEYLPFFVQARAAISLVLNLVHHGRMRKETLDVLLMARIEEFFR